MFSRSHLLIERDLKQLDKDDPWGIEAAPLKDDNIFEIIAKIRGPAGTLWEGGIFRLYLKFNETYNYSPPEACFHTIPFHPNVDMITGKPWLEALCDPLRWKESYTIVWLLTEIQKLLVEPDLDNAVNIEATEMFMYAPHSYQQVVHECVSASQRVEAGLDPHPKIHKQKLDRQLLEQPRPPTAPFKDIKIGKVSFDEYHATWRNIATSKMEPNDKNRYLEAIGDNPTLRAIHYGMSKEEQQLQEHRQNRAHHILTHGIPGRTRKSSIDTDKQDKLNKVNQMRKIYLQQRTPSKMSKESSHKTIQMAISEEPWEKEVDDLVQWTNKLDGANI